MLFSIWILLLIMMFVTMVPPLIWFWMNLRKYRETYNLKIKRIAFWSWFVALGVDSILGAIIAVIAFI